MFCNAALPRQRYTESSTLFIAYRNKLYEIFEKYIVNFKSKFINCNINKFFIILSFGETNLRVQYFIDTSFIARQITLQFDWLFVKIEIQHVEFFDIL